MKFINMSHSYGASPCGTSKPHPSSSPEEWRRSDANSSLPRQTLCNTEANKNLADEGSLSSLKFDVSLDVGKHKAFEAMRCVEETRMGLIVAES